MTRKQHALILAVLLGLSGVIQAGMIWRARVPSLDAVRFSRTAEAIRSDGPIAALRAQSEQPLLPLAACGVHACLMHTVGPFDSIGALSVQLAAATALVLCVVPIYLLILRLSGPAAAVAGSLFFCVLPEVARLGADGISDSWHLLLFCVAFWAIVEVVQQRASADGDRKEKTRRRGFLWLAGLATAVALLARVEVLVLAASFWLVWSATCWRRNSWHAWKGLALDGSAFMLGLAVVLGPYLLAMGDLTPQRAVARVLGRQTTEHEPVSSAIAEQASSWRLPGDEAMSFDVKEPSVSIRRRGYSAAIVLFGRKLTDASGYWIGGLALFGVWRLRRCRARVSDRLVQVFFVFYSVIVIHFAATEGYLAARHLLVLVVAALPAAGYGALEAGTHWRRVAATDGGSIRSNAEATPRGRWAWAMVAVAAAACLPMTLIHLHDSRLGHRQAAAWLAEESTVDGVVLDSQGWTGLYSGRDTYPYDHAPTALADPRLAYVVLEKQELEFDSRRSQTLRTLTRVAAEPVAQFPSAARRKANQQPVVIYRWHPDRFQRLVRRHTNDSIAQEGRNVQTDRGVRG